MKQKSTSFLLPILLLFAFLAWTLAIRTVDVQPIGPNGSSVGFAALNGWFHDLTGVHMTLYTITDWLGAVPFAICTFFGLLGLTQWIKRKSIAKVDADILILGAFFLVVIAGYLFFEAFPINYRTVLIEGRLEASYPSSTTLLVLSVIPATVMQIGRRIKDQTTAKALRLACWVFALFMVSARLISGVHWLTDILGGILLSAGLVAWLKVCTALADKE